MNVVITGWQDPPHHPQLLPEQIHLWRFSLDSFSKVNQYLLSLLSDDEIVRVERLLDSRKRDHFVCARGCLRQILASYLDMHPADIVFFYNRSGKPYLKFQNRDKLTFNLSHSGSLAILAVALDGEVGVDIEEIDPDLNFHLLAHRYLTFAETNGMEKISIERRRRQFYRIWTRKEAVLKMYGTGFSMPGSIESFPPILNHCYLKNIVSMRNYVSAIAVNKRITSIRKFNLLLGCGIG